MPTKYRRKTKSNLPKVILHDNVNTQLLLYQELNGISKEKNRSQHRLHRQKRSFIIGQGVKELELRDKGLEHKPWLPEIVMKMNEPDIKARREANGDFSEPVKLPTINEQILKYGNFSNNSFQISNGPGQSSNNSVPVRHKKGSGTQRSILGISLDLEEEIEAEKMKIQAQREKPNHDISKDARFQTLMASLTRRQKTMITNKGIAWLKAVKERKKIGLSVDDEDDEWSDLSSDDEDPVGSSGR